MVPRETKKITKRSVNYRFAWAGSKFCGNCVMYQPPLGCTLVAGWIKSWDVCDRWAKKPEGST